MRTQEEIQEAHDFLHAILDYNEQRPPDDKMPADLAIRVHVAHDAMGYALGCGCGQAFEKNLETLRKELEVSGFKLMKFTSHPE